MKVTYTSGKISVEIEADTQIELFQQSCQLPRNFLPKTSCGKCSSDNIRFQVRNVDDNLYYEARVCQLAEQSWPLAL